MKALLDKKDLIEQLKRVQNEKMPYARGNVKFDLLVKSLTNTINRAKFISKNQIIVLLRELLTAAYSVRAQSSANDSNLESFIFEIDLIVDAALDE